MTSKRSARVKHLIPRLPPGSYALRIETARYDTTTNTVAIEYAVSQLASEASTEHAMIARTKAHGPSTPRPDQIWLHTKTGRLAVIRSVRMGRVTYRYRTPTGNTRGRCKMSPRTTTTSARKDAFLKSFEFYSDKQGLGLV